MRRYDIWTSLGFEGNPYDQAFLSGTEEGAALFCGRQVELVRTQLGIGSGGSHVAIEGEAGVGKTSLARVAAFDMLQHGLIDTNGSLFVPVEAAMQLGPNPAEFELEVWRNIANTLLQRQAQLRRANLHVPELAGLESWLNSPTVLTGGSANVLGFGGGATSTVNTSSGFGQSGFISLVRRELSRTFPSSAAGGVVCILDNLELLRTSEEARSSLERIRGSLLEVPAIRWVFIGSKGIISHARSRRLSGFIDFPMRLQPLTVEEGVDLVTKRLEYWGTTKAHAPVQPEDFRYLYRTLGLNLRDSLHFAQQFAKHYVSQFMGTRLVLPSAQERPLFFQTWMGEQAELIAADVSGATDDVWRRFDRLCEAGGTSSAEVGDDIWTLLAPLRNAQLVDFELDPARPQIHNIAVTANGWLCHSARPRPRPTDLPAPVLAGRSTIHMDMELNDNGALLPARCRLVDLLDLGTPTPQSIQDRWLSTPRATTALIGIAADGPLTIDLRRDGPHGLVGGTTGSGKSELLQTIIASLAVVNRPDEMNFLLIDYKGGAAFGGCVDLPHTVGLVTDLDSRSAERVLISLRAETLRREALLAHSGARDIDEYHDLDPAKHDLPRLLIVVDEYASLIRTLPDFVPSLVSITQTGRSLGMHLILATQRPSGIVSPQIQANINLRISLRLTDAADSADVIDSPAAATILPETPGRAILRAEMGQLVLFQSARVNVQRADPPSALAKTDASTMSERVVAQQWPVTDLGVLVSAIESARIDLTIPAPRKPVLAPLPTIVPLAGLSGEAEKRTKGSRTGRIPFGLEDHPHEQAQRTASIDLAQFSHLAIAGAPRTGRSQALLTIAASIALRTSPEDVHLYVFDCGNGGLLPLAELPHCGAVVLRHQDYRATRLIRKLTAEIARRYQILATTDQGGVVVQQAHTPSERQLPHIFVLVDRWEAFVSIFDHAGYGDLSDQILDLVTDGAPVGIHLVVTGDQQLLSTRIGGIIEEKIALRMPDSADFASMEGRHVLPEDFPPGRGFRSARFTEMQFALLGRDPRWPSQVSHIRAISSAAASKYADIPDHRRPFRVDDIPTHVSSEDA